MTDVFSWGDSSPEDPFDDDSWMSEPESICNNWRGWKRTTTTNDNSLNIHHIGYNNGSMASTSTTTTNHGHQNRYHHHHHLHLPSNSSGNYYYFKNDDNLLTNLLNFWGKLNFFFRNYNK